MGQVLRRALGKFQMLLLGLSSLKCQVGVFEIFEQRSKPMTKKIEIADQVRNDKLKDVLLGTNNKE